MAKIQTRRAVSISGKTYLQLKHLAAMTKRSGSRVVEDLLQAACSQLPETVIVPVLEPQPGLASEPYDRYRGRKPPELDSDTAAHRLAATIFTF